VNCGGRDVLTKADTLKKFLSQLPSDAARKLLEAVDNGAMPVSHLGLSIDELRECLSPSPPNEEEEEKRREMIQRLFMAPFEDFLFDGEREEKEVGRIPRGSTEPIWNWIQEEVLPDTFPDMLERVHRHLDSGDEEALSAAVTVLQEATAAAMSAALGRTETDPDHFDLLVKKLGHFAILEDAREIADVFMILDEIREMQREVPRLISSFDDRMVSKIRDLYDKLYERDPDRAIYLALALMGRLEFPWQILRLARKVAQKNDDTMISRTDFAILGERLIKRLEIISGHFRQLRPGLSDLTVLHELIVEFAALSSGITKEIELLRIGNWGQRLLKSRNLISTAVSDEFAHYLKDLSNALPLQRVGGFGRGGPRRVDVSHLPNDERVIRIMRELDFMDDVKPLAQAIGAQSAFDRTQPELETYIISYEDAIIEELRYSEPEAAENAEAYLAVACELTKRVCGSAASSTLTKRGRIALQATA